MKKAIIEHLTQDFESYTNQTRNDIEFWFARDLQHLLGYTEWRNFTKVIDKAKDFATEITIFNVKEKDIHQGNRIAWEHITNNQSVRKILLERGIRPEDLPPEEDVKKLERRVKSEDNLLLENPDKLASA